MTTTERVCQPSRSTYYAIVAQWVWCVWLCHFLRHFFATFLSLSLPHWLAAVLLPTDCESARCRPECALARTDRNTRVPLAIEWHLFGWNENEVRVAEHPRINIVFLTILRPAVPGASFSRFSCLALTAHRPDETTRVWKKGCASME